MMLNLRFSILFTAIILTVLAIACSSGSPVIPQNGPQSLDSLPVIALSDLDGVLTGIGTLGMFELQIDPETMSADLVSKRISSAIGDSNLVSGLPFFTMSIFCKECLKHTGIRLTSDGNAILTFQLTHPFTPGNTSLPPNAGNRLDLDIFDVALVIKPIDAAPTTFSGIGASIYDTVCIDPAGYTTELSYLFSPTDTAAMPFFLAVDDSIDQSPPVSTYNKFAMGASTEFDTGFNLSGPTLKFDLYLTMGYGAAARGGAYKETFLDPTYFNPEYNRKNAWKVTITPPSEAWKDNENLPSQTKDVLVSVYDWQVGATVSTDWENETILTNILEASEVLFVAVDVLNVANTENFPTSGTGGPDDPLIFTIPVANTSSMPAGTYTGLVKVSDSRIPATDVSEAADKLIDTPDSIELIPYLLPEFATYQTFPAFVEGGCGPLVFESATGCPSSTVNNGESVDFTISASSNSSPVITYEMDSDYDGVTFDIDYGPNTTGIFDNVIFDMGTGCITGTQFDVAVRITDSCPIPNVQIHDICTVEIGECCSAAGSSWTGEVTDGSTIQNVRYFHTNDYAAYTYRGQAHGLEGMAQGNGYMYSAFYTTGDVYFSRSSDSGETWDMPAIIGMGSSIRGVAIAAVGANVYVLYGDSPSSTATLLKNTNSGSGAWTPTLIRDYTDNQVIHSLCIAVDPNDINFVNVCYVQNNSAYDYVQHLRSTDGGVAFTEDVMPFSSQGHQIDILYNTDSAFYYGTIDNNSVRVKRSDDHGATFVTNSFVSIDAWGTDMDMCADPTNVNVIYVAYDTIGYNSSWSPTLRIAKSSNRALNLSMLHYELEVETGLQENIGDIARHPAVMVDTSGNVYVACSWAFETDYDDFDIYVMKSCDNGTTFPTANQFNIDNAGFDVDPEMFFDPAGGIVLTWAENGYADKWGAANPTGKIVAKKLQ